MSAPPIPFVALSLLESAELPLLVAIEQTDRDVRDSPPHSHAAGQLLGSARGLLSVSCGNSSWVVPATHAMWIPPRQVHGLRSHGPFSGWSAYIAERGCADLPATPRTLRMSGLLREAVHRASGWELGPRTGARAHLAEVVLDEIRTLPEEPLGLAMPVDARLLRIAEAMIADPADGRGLEAWAEWAHVPMRTLSRRFVVETGFTFTAWRQRARLLRSLELLAEGVAVTTIALDLGYDNVSAFIAMFRRTFGVSPRRYGHGG